MSEYKKVVNGVVMDMTADEIAQLEKDAPNDVAMKEKLEAAVKAKADLKASAKAKLIAGEPLTADEADTLVL
tara:strand:+ start:1172 stop:1387 length:216 start_codon:yes stop_codon:yes gene_type:complete